jgi:Nickel responsive protein SCO4226-like
MPRYLIERIFPEGLQIPATDDGAKICLNIVDNNSDDDVTWIHSYVSDDKKKSFCIYEAPTPEAIRKVANKNNLPVNKITEVKVLDPYFYK